MKTFHSHDGVLDYIKKLARKQKLVLLTGEGGSGKTEIIMQLAEEEGIRNCSFCAPTNKAAKNLYERKAKRKNTRPFFIQTFFKMLYDADEKEIEAKDKVQWRLAAAKNRLRKGDRAAESQALKLKRELDELPLTGHMKKIFDAVASESRHVCRDCHKVYNKGDRSFCPSPFKLKYKDNDPKKLHRATEALKLCVMDEASMLNKQQYSDFCLVFPNTVFVGVGDFDAQLPPPEGKQAFKDKDAHVRLTTQFRQKSKKLIAYTKPLQTHPTCLLYTSPSPRD